jgi:toxin ParE1/3/4
MARLGIAPAAVADLEEIWLYIAADNVRRADAFLDRIDDRLRLLAIRPHMGRRRPELGEGIHSWAIGRYVVFYRPLSDGIEVARVLHGARDIRSIS